MGMFDSLRVPCPECQEEVEFQSKAGECRLHEYTLSDLPMKLAADLDGESQRCNCGHLVQLKFKQVYAVQLEVT